MNCARVIHAGLELAMHHANGDRKREKRSMRPKPHAPENYVHAGLSWPPPAVDDKTNDTKPLETLAAQARATSVGFLIVLIRLFFKS